VDVEQEGDGAAELSSGEAGEGALLANELLSEAEEDALLAAVVGGPTEADLEELVRKFNKLNYDEDLQDPIYSFCNPAESSNSKIYSHGICY